jgi:hypothetical protein
VPSSPSRHSLASKDEDEEEEKVDVVDVELEAEEGIIDGNSESDTVSPTAPNTARADGVGGGGEDLAAPFTAATCGSKDEVEEEEEEEEEEVAIAEDAAA